MVVGHIYYRKFYVIYVEWKHGVLTMFRSTWHKLGSSERREPQFTECRQKILLQSIFSVIDGGEGPAHCGCGYLRVGSPGFCKKASEQHPSVAFVSAPASRFCPCLSTCPTTWEYKPNKTLSSPPWFSAWHLTLATETLRHRAIAETLFCLGPGFL